LSGGVTGLNDIACHELDDQEGQGETQQASFNNSAVRESET
jgi:hypothetical protein